MQRPEDIRKMINKQCDFLADDNDDDLKEYTIMKLNDLTLQYQVVLNAPSNRPPHKSQCTSQRVLLCSR